MFSGVSGDVSYSSNCVLTVVSIGMPVHHPRPQMAWTRRAEVMRICVHIFIYIYRDIDVCVYLSLFLLLSCVYIDMFIF